MAAKSIILDADLYFEASVPFIEVSLRDGYIEPILSHRSGIFADANLYRPAEGRSLISLFSLAGASALSSMQTTWPKHPGKEASCPPPS